MNEAEKRPNIVAAAIKKLRNYLNKIDSLNNTHPWISDEDRSKTKDKVAKYLVQYKFFF